MFRKTMALGLAAIVLTGALAGCGGGTQKEANPAAGSTTAGSKLIRYNMGAEPRYLDPALATDSVSISAVTSLNEGLVRLGPKGAEPGIATKWEEKDGGLKYVFTLRDNAKFSNGDPITADDVVYSWTRALDPRIGSEYAYQLYYIKGGEALNNLKADAPDFQQQFDAAVKALGVKAVDAKTVEVTLEAPTPYFIALTSFPTLNVVDKKVVEANKDWAAKAETYVSAGPYKLVNWEHKKQLDLVKNENYWDAANVKTDKLTFYMVEEQATFLNMYESNQLDVTEQPGASEAPRLLKEGQLKVAPMFGTYFWNFNVTKAPFDNVKVRQALSLAIDRNAIVKNVMRGGQLPAYAFVSPGAFDADGKTDYRQVGGDLFKEDLAKAKQLLAEAGYPNGLQLDIVAYRERNQTEALIGYLQAVGIKTNLRFLQYAAMREQIATGKAMLTHQTWGSFSVNDVSAATPNYFAFRSEDITRDAAVRDLLEKGNNSVDPAVRKVFYYTGMKLID